MKNTTPPMICDTCKQQINSQADAFVEWLDTNDTISDVHIVHNKPSSPHGDCFQHTTQYHRRDLELPTILNNPVSKKKLGLF